MPMKSVISENDGILIEKIKKQSKEIIDEIEKKPSESLDKIKDWVNQIKLESLLSDEIQLLATIIDAIHRAGFKNESNKIKKNLIESCFSNLINKLNHIPQDEILAIVSYLKRYIKTNNDDAKAELEKFIGKSTSSTNHFALFSDISKQIVLSYEKSKSRFNNPFKTNLNTIPIAGLVSEADSECQISFFEDAAYHVPFTNNFPKSKGKIMRKKIKPKIIIFDDDNGIGYDNSSSHWYYKEIKRLAEINLEIEFSPKMEKKKLLEEELNRLDRIDIRGALNLNKLKRQNEERSFELFASNEEKKAKLLASQRVIHKSKERSKRVREILKISQKKAAKEKKISKLLDPVVFFIQNEIDIFKGKVINIGSLDSELPSFDGMKDDLLTEFLYSIDYDNFKKLIKSAGEILTSIDEIKKTLNKLDDFAKNLGYSLDYIYSLDQAYKKIKVNFSREVIITFLESSLNLFKQRTLILDNKIYLLKIKDQKPTIQFHEPEFLSLFISHNCPKKILKLNSEHMAQFFSQNDDTLLFNKGHLENEDNLLKLLLNFFSGKYYFLSHNHKDKFVKKFFLKFQEFPNFESIRSEMFKLKWWQFILMGISPFYIIKKNFKDLLSEKLFLNLIEEEFRNINKESYINYIDDLYSIQNRLKSSNIGDKSDSIPLSFINAPQSRQEIIDRLNNREEIKELVEKISNLANSAMGCVSEFSRILSASQQEAAKFPPSTGFPNKYFFKNVPIRGSFLPINTANNFSPSYTTRRIN